MSVGDAPAGVCAKRESRGGQWCSAQPLVDPVDRADSVQRNDPAREQASSRHPPATRLTAAVLSLALLLAPSVSLAEHLSSLSFVSSRNPAAGGSPRIADPLPRTGAAELRRARNAFEYGDFEAVVDVLDGLGESGQLVLEQERVEAYRLLGLALFYLGRRDEAATAFFDLLKQNPDYQLDPFYVPPHAVAFFDDVKKESEPLLAPIRERRTRRIQEERAEEQARQEAERRRREQLAREAPDDEEGTFVVRLIERRVVENSPLVAWMPFGLGQFQNGHRQLGTALLATEAVAAAVSLLSFWAIEGLRDPRTGQFSDPAHDIATRLDTAKYISAGIFYGLWLIGAIDANLRFVPTRVVAEGPAGTERPGSSEPPMVLDRSTAPSPSAASDRPVTPAPSTGTAPSSEAAPGVSPDDSATRGSSTESTGSTEVVGSIESADPAEQSSTDSSTLLSPSEASEQQLPTEEPVPAEESSTSVERETSPKLNE